MNAGLSGTTLSHSDIGAYTSTSPTAFYHFNRSQTMLYRWIEMSTFSDVIMRSHPANKPLENYQIYDSIESIIFFKKFVKIHVALSDYKL